MNNLTQWNIPVTPELDAKVELAVKNGMFTTKSELVRTAVRRLLHEQE